MKFGGILDIGTILTIIGLFITCVGIFWTWKTIFRPKIEIISEDITEIANVGKLSNELIIRYKNEEVSSDLLSLSAYIINTGNSDIGVSDVEQPITLDLPKNSSWLSFVVTKNNHSMKIEGLYEKNSLVINTGLWKKGEGFKFDALVTTSNSDILEDKNKIFKLIKINSRIKGLGDIQVTSHPQEIIYKNLFSKYLKLFLPLVAAMSYVILGIAIYMGVLTKEKFSLEIYNDKYEIVETQKKDKSWILKSLDAEYPKDKEGYYNVKVKLSSSPKNNVGDEGVGLFTILMGLILIVAYYSKYIKNYLLKKKILRS